MFRRLTAFGLSLALLPLVAWTAADEKVTLVVPGIQCANCVERLSSSLSMLSTTIQVGAVGTETKQMPVTYDPSKVTLHQLVQAVADTPPVHGKPYAAGVHVTIEDAEKSASKVKKGLGQVKGVMNFMTAPGASDPGEIMVVLKPLARNAKLADHVKASQIAEALEKAGVKFDGLPGGSAGGTAENDPKKKPTAAKGTAKTKSGDGDSAAEKTKPTRTTPGTAKTKPARDPATSPAKSKDDDSEEKPRFQILAGDEDKVYLIDHETKSDEGKLLQKLVKDGDKFGDYIVKEVGDDDGLYVVLEHAETKETTRVEKKKKEKDKDGDKPAASKEKEAGDKDKGEEKKDKDQ